MKILFLTIGSKDIASSRVRVYGYLPFLKGRALPYKIISFTSRAKERRILRMKEDALWQRVAELFYKITAVTRLLASSKNYDVIFVQKVILPKPVWDLLRALNRRIVFDFDDAIYLYKDITYLLKDAAVVLVSNRSLKEFASRYSKNVYELVSPVSIKKEASSKRETGVTLGWMGSPETSRYLYPLMPVFKELKEKFRNLKIEFTGSRKDKNFDSLNITMRDWSLEGEKAHFECANIGIMPLENDEWSRSKAGYKLLLYMSKGLPCVASPVGINNEIIKDGVSGYLAEAPEEWSKKLSMLIEDRALREKLGREALKKVEKFYSYEVCAPRMLNILTGLWPINRKLS